MNVTVEPGQYEFSVPEVVTNTFGGTATFIVSASERLEQAFASIVELAVSGRSYTNTSTTSPVTNV